MTLTPRERKLLQEAVVFGGQMLAYYRQRLLSHDMMDIRDKQAYDSQRQMLDKAERILFRSEEPK